MSRSRSRGDQNKEQHDPNMLNTREVDIQDSLAHKTEPGDETRRGLSSSANREAKAEEATNNNAYQDSLDSLTP